MGYLARHLDAPLLDWLHTEPRKPLVLKGARQTGKTTTARRLGEATPLFLEVNLERVKDREMVRACHGADDLLEALALRENLTALPPGTLLFLDEVQEIPEVISWLRFFHEDHPHVAVLCAGSLLEVRLTERGFSFPVGRVTFAALEPFSFGEFLGATDRSVLLRRLQEAVETLTQLPGPVHAEALNALGEYMTIGGMPEAVVTWGKTSSASAVARVHADLWQALSEDIQKYRGSRDPGHIEAAFSSLRHHYGQRFKYENFAQGHASRPMRSALDRLEGARLVTRAVPTSSVTLPLRTKARAAPKLIPLDVGLATHGLGLDPLKVRSADLLQMLDGRLAEMLVGQMLRPVVEAKGAAPLHFWVRQSPQANAEVDFLLPTVGRAVPIEVKSGSAGALRSLHQFLVRTDHRLGVRLHSGGLALEKHESTVGGRTLAWRLLNAPLYLAEFCEDLVNAAVGRGTQVE